MEPEDSWIRFTATVTWGHSSSSANWSGDVSSYYSTIVDVQSTMLRNSKSASSGKMTQGLDSMNLLSASNLSKAAPFFAALEQQLYQPIIPRKSVNGRPIPADEAISMARQQPTEDIDDNNEALVGSNYFDVPYEADGPQEPIQEAKKEEEEEEEGLSLETARRRISVTEARVFLRDFIEARWEDQLHAGYIKIQCDQTMEEIREFGLLDKAEGSKECRKLVSAPVIHDAIGYALWSELASEVILASETPGKSSTVKIATSVNTSLVTATATQEKTQPPTTMKTTIEQEIAARRARSMRRRATDGDAIAVQSAPRIASTYMATTARARRKSDMHLVRPHQVICTTCGSRAVPEPKHDDNAMSDDEDVQGEAELEFRERKRDSISRRLSVKMNKTLTKFGEGLATGYGGNGVSRVTG
ncbi:hypothetical protein ColTof4_09936 [Colletotrichum tofieldiae]|uniref:Uncharacterized protein n=1 Tax=Colletotrichum tofieldiae TaxID=708197 RepID=A0A166QNT4_9PEZI|nr:hypothetical protein CT0861_03927 [Colletotrichum tofieldiae]GKT77513.1 hypothetical protein ColTof4_09936 [Colletotrichum tofieldiae]GKT86079.1 hypothetical protein Ct61P_03929 [Colletotrichum tofieldiae]